MKNFNKIIAGILLFSPAFVCAQVNKPVIAVVSIEGGNEEIGNFKDMIESAIIATNKFRTIERTRLDKLVAEQAKAKAKVVNGGSGAVAGFSGVDYVVYGSITGFQEKEETVPLFNCKTKKVILSVDIRLTEVSTGEVKYSRSIDQQSKGATQCQDFGGSTEDASAVLRLAADNIASSLVFAIFPVTVIASQPDGSLLLNYGEGTMQVGAQFTAFRKGDVIRDPSTGEVLGSNDVRLGQVEVTAVAPKFSTAMPIDFEPGVVAVGDVLRPATSKIKPKKKKK